MSQSMAAFYLKDKGLDTSSKWILPLPFTNLFSASHVSNMDSAVRESPRATTVSSSVVMSVSSGVQTVSTFSAPPLFPTSAPVASTTFGPLQANSTPDSLASASADQSTIQSVLHHLTTLVPSKV